MDFTSFADGESYILPGNGKVHECVTRIDSILTALLASPQEFTSIAGTFVFLLLSCFDNMVETACKLSTPAARASSR